jgi:protein involved in polysaccharide export with SLBB domain
MVKTVACGILLCMAAGSCARNDGGTPGREVSVVPASKTHVVNGEVKAPGEQEWKEGITLSAAIEKAGGVTDKAKADSINLVRMKQVTIHDLEKIKSGAAVDTPIMAGDVITVPRVLER